MKNNRLNLFSAVFGVAFIFVILLSVQAGCVEVYDPFEDDFGEEEYEEPAPMKDSDYQDPKISKRRLSEIIQRAIFSKNFDKKSKVKEMIENGLLIDISSKHENTLLAECARMSNFKEVKLLLELGANPNYLDESSESVLKKAVTNSSRDDDFIDTVHLLIETVPTFITMP